MLKPAIGGMEWQTITTAALTIQLVVVTVAVLTVVVIVAEEIKFNPKFKIPTLSKSAQINGTM